LCLPNQLILKALDNARTPASTKKHRRKSFV
jgi:hypothetical protein